MLRSRAVNLLAAIVVGALFLTGLLLDGFAGGLLLLGVAALLALLTAAAWAHLPSRGRPLRIAVIAVVVLVAATKLA